jgi:hypothetical protein
MSVKKIAAFSLRRTVGLLNSAAYARAARNHSSLGRERFSANPVMNAIATAITGQAGIAEVRQNVHAIEVERRKLFDGFLTSAAKAIHNGPASYIEYLKAVQKGRDDDLRAVQDLFRQVANIDNRIAGNLGTAVKACAVVQFGSTIFVAVTPVGLTLAGASTAFTAGMIGFGYSVTNKLVKDVHEAKHAGVIAFDVDIDVGKKIVDLKADQAVENAAKRIETQEGLIEQAQQKLNSLSQSIERKVSSRKLAKLQRQVVRTERAATDAERAVKVAKYGKFAGRALQVVFAAHDIYEGWEDFEKAWDSERP